MQAKPLTQTEAGRKRFRIKVYQVAFVLTLWFFLRYFDRDLRGSFWLGWFQTYFSRPLQGLHMLVRLDPMQGMKAMVANFVLAFLYTWGVFSLLLWCGQTVGSFFFSGLKFFRRLLRGNDHPSVHVTNERSGTKP